MDRCGSLRGSDEDFAKSGDPGVADERESDPEAMGKFSELSHPCSAWDRDEEDRVEATAGDLGYPEDAFDFPPAGTRAEVAGEEAVRDYDALSPLPPFTPSPPGFGGSHSTSPLVKSDIRQTEVQISGRGSRRETVFHRVIRRLSSSESGKKLPRAMEYVSALAHLATFGMLGILIRYGLEVLFGPQVATVTDDRTALFTDLPANMLGSFFMGWVGVVFKKHISLFSELLAVGLSTGLMGSITTFASQNQRMLAVFVAGHWVRALFGLMIGTQLSWMSLIAGIDSANSFLAFIKYLQQARVDRNMPRLEQPESDNLVRRWKSFWLFFVVAVGMWVAFMLLSLPTIDRALKRRVWLACAVGPPGVWTRWHLARLNGHGVGQKRWLKWLPVGTLLANVVASSLEAALATVEIAVDNADATLLVGALQLGFLGCMSTVSTFVVEVHVMHQGDKPWRAYVYAVSSLGCSFLVGILVYGVPVWSLRLNSRSHL